MSSVGAPSLSGYRAVWTGTHMILWGAGGFGARYVAFNDSDEDGDGFSICGGDCDDSDPAANPGSVETCDGKDNDCDTATDNGGAALCDDGAYCTEDSCGGSAGCLNAPLTEGFSCPEGLPAGECLLAATCDGEGQCRNTFVASGTPCGDSMDTACTNPDSCDGAGACVPNHEADGTACRVHRRGHHHDDDDDDHGGHDGGHGGNDAWAVWGGDGTSDGNNDDDGHHGSRVCIQGTCVKLGGSGGEDEDYDGMLDHQFDSLRLRMEPGVGLILTWDEPEVPPGTSIQGYRIWRRSIDGWSWELVSSSATRYFAVPVAAATPSEIWQVTAITQQDGPAP